MKAGQEGEGNTAGATKVVHAHVRANALEELVAWIGDNGWVLQDRDLAVIERGWRDMARLDARKKADETCGYGDGDEW
jgi:hypothetical protein